MTRFVRANIQGKIVAPKHPSRIGRYEIKSPLGQGGMGSLYLAHDPNTNRLVAIKLLDATLNSAEFRERFVREARALAAVNHPNIVSVYDTGEYEGAPYIVMEYVRGETLAEVIQRRAPIPMAQRVRWMAELCAGLGQAHEARVIHRDIKPANLIVDQQGRLKILDFGIARVDLSTTTVGLPLTMVNVAIGTPGYMSPEQLESGEVDHRSDIFAAGAVCYELFTYVEAFPGHNTGEVGRKVATCKPLPLTDVAQGLDPAFDEVVLRALQKDPNRRYQEASSFERALEHLRAGLEVHPDVATPTRSTPASGTSRAKSRELRAEAAYQRARAAHDEGATDVARRFAVEALAEDPTHRAARALLASFEPVPPPRLPQTAVPARSLATAVTTSIEPTMIVDPSATSPRADPRDTSAGAQTIIVPTGPKRQAGRAGADRLRADRSAPQPSAWHVHADRLRARLAALGPASRSLKGYKSGAMLVGAAAALVLVTVFTVRFLPMFFTPSARLTLTIQKPENGTLTADVGIRCGSRGDDCTVTLKEGDTVELQPLPDDGFVLGGYSGDCLPVGRTRMTGARTCGAVFEKLAPGHPGPSTVTMKIEPVPTGGTVQGVEIVCGSKGSACTASYPLGEVVPLQQFPDDGYTFMGFSGDCLTGQVHMSVDRTCSARFQKTSELKPPDPPPVRPGPRPRTPASLRTADKGKADEDAGKAAEEKPPTGAPSPPPTRAATSSAQASTEQVPVAPQKVDEPQTEEAFAKDRIKEILTAWCQAYEDIDPDAVQRAYPRVDMRTIREQLNRRMYRSVKCSMGDLKYVAVDAKAGKATLQTEVTRVFEHTVAAKKKDESKVIGTFSLGRLGDRSQWFIESAQFKQ